MCIYQLLALKSAFCLCDTGRIFWGITEHFDLQLLYTNILFADTELNCKNQSIFNYQRQISPNNNQVTSVKSSKLLSRVTYNLITVFFPEFYSFIRIKILSGTIKINFFLWYFKYGIPDNYNRLIIWNAHLNHSLKS